jgi:hypothetical protein
MEQLIIPPKIVEAPSTFQATYLSHVTAHLQKDVILMTKQKDVILMTKVSMVR